jgi:glycosyltransferase involved in cell wall biosynthesis
VAVVDVVIPALDEAASIGRVLADIPRDSVRRVVVADNGSRDATADVAARAGAIVVNEPRRGYGSACLAGIAALASDPPDIVVFLDADWSDHPEELPQLVAPIVAGRAELVIGSRLLGRAERGALAPQARHGNRLACFLLGRLYGARFTDLGPFRAIRWTALASLDMRDTNFGWTVEMQLKAARAGLACAEVPVRYRRRIGVSKITGTVSGTLRAGAKILWTIFYYAWLPPEAPRRASARERAKSVSVYPPSTTSSTA